MAENQSKRVQSVEFLRFVGCCIIVYFHVLHHNIIPFTNDSALYRQLASMPVQRRKKRSRIWEARTV